MDNHEIILNIRTDEEYIAYITMKAVLEDIVRKFRAHPLQFSAQDAATMAEAALVIERKVDSGPR